MSYAMSQRRIQQLSMPRCCHVGHMNHGEAVGAAVRSCASGWYQLGHATGEF